MEKLPEALDGPVDARAIDLAKKPASRPRAPRAPRVPRAPRARPATRVRTSKEAPSVEPIAAAPPAKSPVYEEKAESLQYYYPSGDRNPEGFKPKPEKAADQRNASSRRSSDSRRRRPQEEPRRPQAQRREVPVERPQKSGRQQQQKGQTRGKAQPQEREPSSVSKDYTQYFLQNVYKQLGSLRSLRQEPFITSVAAIEGFVSKNASAPFLLTKLRKQSLEAIIAHNEANGLKPQRAPKNSLVQEALNAAITANRPLLTQGVLEFLDEGDALLLDAADNYKASRFSVYIPACWIAHYGLRKGHTLSVQATAYGSENLLWVSNILSVEGLDPQKIKDLPHFEKLEPYYPTQRLFVEQPQLSGRDLLSMRVVDLLTPIGLGQRALIVAPPRAGKTLLLQGMAHAMRAACPQAEIIVLLVDERPEEIADFQDAIDGQVISSTFDEPPQSHVHISELVIERARRAVEAGHHVILFLDSITRLARAHNALTGKGGRTLSGGIDANAMQRPRRFFSSARNIEGGGSLTLIATVLVGTESRMDDLILEEFKGTGNMELYLDRELADKRIYPAIHWEKSGTRKEELLYHPEELEKIFALRRLSKNLPPSEALSLLIKRLKQTQSNAEFLMALNGL